MNITPRQRTGIGIVQGRLSPPVGGRIQAFPAAHWREEFSVAAQLGLDSIEWILESPLEQNPFSTEAGLAQIREVVLQTGVRVEFILADYFMESPFVRMSAGDLERNRSVLRHAIDQAAGLGVQGIEIPCVDASEIRSLAEEEELAAGLASCLDYASSRNVEVGLETSLPPDRFRALLERIAHPALKANYDTGNSASLGYDPVEEIEAYGAWINNVHIKDRVRGGGTVPLGTGDTDIPKVLRLLKSAGYRGGFFVQGARGSDETETAGRYKALVEAWLLEAGF